MQSTTFVHVYHNFTRTKVIACTFVLAGFFLIVQTLSFFFKFEESMRVRCHAILGWPLYALCFSNKSIYFSLFFTGDTNTT